jgi:myxalamid-type polyketide synthase MxaE and MxaD
VNADGLRGWLVARIAATLRVDPATIEAEAPFDSYGLSSTEAVALSGDLQELLGRELPATLVYEYPTISRLARYLARSSDSEHARPPDAGGTDPGRRIAIVGIGCRFPGAGDPLSYWDLLCDGRDMIREVPADRWDMRAYYHPDPSMPAKAVSRWGGFLDAIDGFDAFFFGISPGEAERMDPQQRLALELAYEAFEDAGCSMARLAGSRTGVFVGISVNEYAFQQHGRLELINGHSGTGNALAIAANRISYFFDLHGPSMAVDTACSSSLMAVHLACRSLRSGECDLALAGGVNVILSPAHAIAFTKAGVLAPDGRCKVFDARADGYVRGEGGGFVVLKSLARARAEGDIIYAVIRGSAVQQDGRTNGLLAPSREAQEAVLRAAYQDAGVSPKDVQYVEAHGTGTLLGDSIEARALGAVLGRERSSPPCALGSVKSNLGHLEAAAGVAGLVKVALALEHRAIPASLHFATPNPHIPFAELGLRVQDQRTPWPERSRQAPALAGVSSFGFGGTDVHVVLEEAPESEPDCRANPELAASDQVCLLPLSAHAPAALAALARAHAELLSGLRSDAGIVLHDVCAAASLRRNHLPQRLAAVAWSKEEMIERLERFAAGADPAGVIAGRSGDCGKLAFVFSGQGGQWHGMGRELLRQEPVFRATLEHCEAALRRHVEWSLLDQLAADAGRSRLQEIDVVQPALFAIQVALAALWQSWGIAPVAVIGHSMGEVAAAHVAGALTLEDAVRVICARSRLLRRLSGRGGMAVVGLGTEETARRLAGAEQRLAIAASNSPRSTVVAGEVAAIDALIAELELDGIFCSLVNVDVASHSSQTAPLGDELRQCLQGLGPSPPALPFVSTVTGVAGDALLDADYWAKNLTEPVSFAAAIRELIRTGHRAFVEISPHPVLQGSVQQGMMQLGEQGMVLPSTKRDEPECSGMLLSLGALYTAGHAIDWAKVYPSPRRRVPLPAYPWQRERYWIDPTANGPGWLGGGTVRRDAATHPLMGSAVELARSPGSWVWQFELDASRAAYLRDHRVNGAIVIPASAFVEMALAAGADCGVAQSHVLEGLELRRALVLPEGEPRTVQVALFPEDQGVRSFGVYSRSHAAEREDWLLHATASFVPMPTDDTSRNEGQAVIASLTDGGAERVQPDALYRALAQRGLQYGPSFRGMEAVWRRNGEAIGRVSVPELLRHEVESYRIHPTLLDAALQVLAAAALDTSADDGFIPVACRRARLHGPPGPTLWSHVVLRPGRTGAREVEADIRLLDDSGRVIGQLDGVRLVRVAPERHALAVTVNDTWLYGVHWRQVAWPTAAELRGDAARRWIILADGHGVAEALRDLLEGRGQSCALLALDGAVEALLEAERAPLSGVIHLWSAEAGPPGPASSASLRAAQTIGCAAAVRLVQGLVARAGPLGTPRLWLVTRGTQPVLAGDTVSPTQAPLWGLGRTIGFELPELKCTLVDLDPGSDACAAADLLFRELCAKDAEDQIAIRGDRRLVPRLVPLAQRSANRSCPVPAPMPWRPDATYLITGGLGGLGLAVAEWMVMQGARHLALVGRRPPAPQADAATQRMRREGVEVSVLSADVASETQVAAMLGQIHKTMPPLRGLVHAAGVLDNASIVTLDAERLARVMAPKVEGAWNLHAATAHEQLDFFVMFSSAVSVLGSPGQGNYSAANAFLDALAHYRQRQGLPAISINWGPWTDIGMVAGEFGQARQSETQGIKGIRPHRGLELLGQALVDGRAQLTVLPFDMAALLDLYPTAARIPFFAEVGGRHSHVARLYARPHLRQEYVAPRNEIERKLVELWRQTLRIDQVGVRDSFFELGGDSVLAAQVVMSAHRAFGVAIDLREAFQAFTIEHLARRVESALMAKVESLSEGEVQRLLEQ